MKTFKGALSLLVIGFFFLEKIGDFRKKSDGADKADWGGVMVRRFDEMMI